MKQQKEKNKTKKQRSSSILYKKGYGKKMKAWWTKSLETCEKS